MALIREATIRATQSLLTPEFRKGYKNQPPQIQAIVELKYIRWRKSPESLNFEPKFKNIFVVEITKTVHAVCETNGTVVRWLWIGNYKDYSARLDSLRGK